MICADIGGCRDFTFESHSVGETEELALLLAKKSKPGDVFCLTGDLGAGKTVFAKGFARGLGYRYDVTSPTFTLMNIYGGGRLTLYHFDLYRLENGMEDLESIGYEDYFYSDGVCLIEWAERVNEAMPDDARWISISRDLSRDEKYRRITAS